MKAFIFILVLLSTACTHTDKLTSKQLKKLHADNFFEKQSKHVIERNRKPEEKAKLQKNIIIEEKNEKINKPKSNIKPPFGFY